METKWPVLTRGPRQRLSTSEKILIVQESHQPGAQVAEIARKYNVGLSSLVKWRHLVSKGSLMSIQNNENLVPSSQVKELKKKIRQLERLLGRKTAQVELLNEALEIARQKKFISRQPLPGIDDIAKD